MDQNRKYRETDEGNDNPTERPNYNERKDREGYDAEHGEVEDDYDDDGEIGTDYENLEDRWYEIQNDYRERYPDLTDEDLNVEPGRFDRTLVRIGRRTYRSPDQVRQDIENWR